jgi:hypothetical protein
MTLWVWQHPQWHRFGWQAETLAPLLRQIALVQISLLGLAPGSEPAFQAEFCLAPGFAAQHQAVVKVSKSTATRQLAERTDRAWADEQ